MLEISFKPSKNSKLKSKYLQSSKVQSVRGGKDYKLSSEAKAFLKKGSSGGIGFFRRLFWCCSRRDRSSLSRERSIKDRNGKKGKKSKKGRKMITQCNLPTLKHLDEDEDEEMKDSQEYRKYPKDDESENKEGGREQVIDLEVQKTASKIPTDREKEPSLKSKDKGLEEAINLRFRKVINLKKVDDKTNSESKSEDGEDGYQSDSNRNSDSIVGKSEDREVSDDRSQPSKPRVRLSLFGRIYSNRLTILFRVQK